MPLSSIFFEFIGEDTFGYVNMDHHPKTIRNINWRLRFEQSLHEYPNELTEMWVHFFNLLTNQGEMTSDKLMAAAQMMFQIEEYLKVTPSGPQKAPKPKLSDWITNPYIPPSAEFMKMLDTSIDKEVAKVFGVPIKLIYGNEVPGHWAASAPVFQPLKKKP